MERYVPKGIVGAFSADYCCIKRNVISAVMALFYVSQLYITSHSVALPNYWAIAGNAYTDNKSQNP